LRSQELISLLQEPNLVDENTLPSLVEMVDKYPYSNIFQLLLAKGMHNVGDLSLDDRIRKAALITPERGVLYDLIYAKKMQEIISKVELSIEEVVVEVPEKVEVDAIEEIIDTEILDEEVETEDITIPLEEEKDDLQQNIILEAINTTIQLDVDELLKEDRFNIADAPDILESLKEGSEEEVEAFSTPLRFSDWLVSMKTIEEKVDESKTPKPLNSSTDLIDKFIASKPRKIDVTKEPLTPKELGRLSLVENEDFVTETLAGIYAKQGKYSKAIKIYEQLILNFPEKSTFFASRIRFLKEKMEYDNN
jgi:tetratricopeptide (TPR) repeat protein